MGNLALTPLLFGLAACGVKTPEGPISQDAENKVNQAQEAYGDICNQVRGTTEHDAYLAVLASLDDPKKARTRAILDSGCFDASEWTCTDHGAKVYSIAICNDDSANRAPKLTDADLAVEPLWRYGFTADQIGRIDVARATFLEVCPQLSYHTLERSGASDEGQKKLQDQMYGAVEERDAVIFEAGFTSHMAWMCRGRSGEESKASLEPWLLSPKKK